MDSNAPRVVGVLGVLLTLGVLVAFARTTAVDEAATTTLDFSPRTTTTVAEAPPTTIPDHDPDPTVTGPIVTTRELSAPGWTRLDPGTLTRRTGFAVAAADRRIVVWGGTNSRLSERVDGAVYAPGGWTQLPPASITSGVNPATAWTGTDLFVYSGAAAAWNPDTGWRQLAYPPTGTAQFTGHPLAATWTGTEVIVVGYEVHPPTFEDNLFVASYGPDLGCCRTYPDPPISLTYGEAIWTGDELLLIGVLVDSEREAVGGQARLAGFDPTSETWTTYEPPPIGADGRIAAAWTGEALVVVDMAGDAARWTKNAGWTQLPDLPTLQRQCEPTTAAVGRDVYVQVCNEAAMWIDGTDRWVQIFTPPVDEGFPSFGCVPVTLPPSSAEEGDDPTLYVWCATIDDDPTFWRLDPDRFEASRWSPALNGEEWRIYPNRTLTSTTDPTMVWSGEELLFFCGHGETEECSWGWGLDPQADRFHRIPQSPNPGRYGQVSVWTGSDMIVVRGGGGTAYDPFTREWTPIALSERSVSSHPGAVWTGDEVLLYGSAADPSASGVAYDPRLDAWRDLSSSPLGPSEDQVVAWGDGEMFVFGGWSSPGTSRGGEARQDGAAYEPTSDTWRLLPPLPGDRNLSGTAGGFVDGRFVIVGANWDQYAREGEYADQPLVAGFTYDSSTDSWSEITSPGGPDWIGEGFAGSMSAVAHGDELAVYLGSFYFDPPRIGLYSPSTDRWRYLELPPIEAYGADLVSGTMSDDERFLAYLTDEGTVVRFDD